jgi:hypothetical protein
MLICNDRRWAEGWRAYGLQGVELMCIGYVSVIYPQKVYKTLAESYLRHPYACLQNTTAWAPQLWGIDPDSMTREAAAADAMFHHKLVCQAHAYTNSSGWLAFSLHVWDNVTDRSPARIHALQLSLSHLPDAELTTESTLSSVEA